MGEFFTNHADSEGETQTPPASGAYDDMIAGLTPADEFFTKAATVAAESFDQPLGEERPSVSAPLAELSVEARAQAITQAYDAFQDKVESQVDKSIDRTVAEYQLDPAGTIRKEYAALKAAEQARLNSERIGEMRDADYQAATARAETIDDPVARERALRDIRLKKLSDERNRTRLA